MHRAEEPENLGRSFAGARHLTRRQELAKGQSGSLLSFPSPGCGRVIHDGQAADSVQYPTENSSHEAR
jgi:hypothetical protein